MTEPLGELEFRRLLVAVDGSEGSDLALSAAITAARHSNATVTLVSVAPLAASWPAATGVSPVLQEDVDAGTARILREAVERIPDDVPVTTMARRGRAGHEIVAVAVDGAYDAIVLGARGVGRFHGLIGSVSQDVLRHAKIAVIVAHSPS